MKKILLLTFLLFPSLSAFTQKDRKVVVMDMTSINQETNTSRFLAVVRMMRSTGVPFEITNNLDSAILYPVIITGSRIESNKLTLPQITTIENYVSGGGVFITSSMRDSLLFNLCGISGYFSDDSLFTVQWNTAAGPLLFSQVNDSLETTVSLGDTASGSTFFTRAYYLSSAVTYGNYENGLSALAVNNYGNGKVYTFGPDFRDISIRNQLDLDINAQRTYSNGFEPTSDVFMFILRNIVRAHIPNTVYKHSSPGKTSAVIMITHDIDSWSGVDTMGLFSSFEQQRGISALYNITTRYFNDGWMTSFYIGSHSRIEALKTNGHKLASHSVGHFPDFDNETRFPYGNTGNTAASYQPYYTGGITTGGTVMGEAEVSKNLVEDDHSVTVRSFRAGHLCFNDSLVTALAQMGYEFNSTHSANNVLTAFPYYNFMIRSFGSYESPILEIPMTISDVFSSDPINDTNYLQKAGIWTNVTRKYEENNAPVVLLIHPNRTYKLNALQAYLDSLSPYVTILNMETFGDFWRKRDSLEFHTDLTGDTLLVYMDNNILHPGQSFIIDTAGLETVLFFDMNGNGIDFSDTIFSAGQLLYYPEEIILAASPHPKRENSLKIFPNPASEEITVLSNGNPMHSIRLSDITGKILLQHLLNYQASAVISVHQLSPGIYFITVTTSDGNETRPVVIKR